MAHTRGKARSPRKRPTPTRTVTGANGTPVRADHHMTGKRVSDGTRKPPAPPLTQEQWQQAVSAYLEHAVPGHPGHTTVAAQVGITPRQALNAWEGTQSLPSIRDTLKLTHEKTRAALVPGSEGAGAGGRESELDALAEHKRLQMERAAEQAGRTRAAEASLVSATRTNTALLQASVSRLLRGALGRADELEAHVAERMSPGALVRFIGECGKLLHEANSAAKLSLEMERTLMGEPTEIIGINATHMSPQDAMRTLELARKTWERLQKKGSVIDVTPAPGGPLPGDAGEPPGE